MKKQSFYIDPDIMAAIEQLAKDQGRHAVELVREGLIKVLIEYKSLPIKKQ